MIHRRCTLDFETANDDGVDLTVVGAAVYAMHPATRVVCLGYRLQNQSARLWTPDMPFPDDLCEAIERGDVMDAHNCSFERMIWTYIMIVRHAAPEIREEQWDDTMAAAAYRALPLPLDKVARVLETEHQKDAEGHKAMLQLTKPRKPTKTNPHTMHGVTAGLSHSAAAKELERLQRCYDYCVMDVDTEHDVRSRLGPLPAHEMEVWRLDQRINMRGIMVDKQMVDVANRMVDVVLDRAERELAAMTSGAVTGPGEVKKIVEWCNQYWPIDNLRKETVEDAVKALRKHDPFSPALRVLEVRQLAGKASIKKLRAMRATMCPDQRIRWLLQYYAASTGRWAGRLVQPQNFPRLLKEYEDLDQLTLAEDIRLGDLELLEAVYGDPIEAISQALRTFFIAGPNRHFVAADLSAIEGVVTAFLAGETWKIEAFREIKAGRKYNGFDDLYCATASKILKRQVSKKGDKVGRQIGKVSELYFGYEGGLGAWRGASFWKEPGNEDTYSDEEVHAFKNAWRDEHPATRQMWRDMKNACSRAVRDGTVQETHGCVFSMRDNCLTIRLPSGRLLWYWGAHVEQQELLWSEPDDPAYDFVVYYWTWKKGQWRETNTYGGKLVENIVQAIARDILVHYMFICEAENLPIVLTVHDEIVTEPLRGHGSKKMIEQIMSSEIEWFRGCPIAASGFDELRYMK